VSWSAGWRSPVTASWCSPARLRHWLGKFEGPVRLFWGTRDRHFTIGLGRRLAAAFRRDRLGEVADATTFVSIDRPRHRSQRRSDVLAKSHT